MNTQKKVVLIAEVTIVACATGKRLIPVESFQYTKLMSQSKVDEHTEISDLVLPAILEPYLREAFVEEFRNRLRTDVPLKRSIGGVKWSADVISSKIEIIDTDIPETDVPKVEVFPMLWKNGDKLKAIDVGTEGEDDFCEEGLKLGMIVTVEDPRFFKHGPFITVRYPNGKLKWLEKRRFEMHEKAAVTQ